MSESGLIVMGPEGATVPQATSIATATDFLSSDVTPKNSRSTFRLTVAFATAAKLSYISDDGSNPTTNGFNDDTDLTAGQTYVWCWGVDATNSYNFRHDDAGAIVINQFLLEEIVGGVI
tara:strand:- start:456 stop:812 length:357 start_codon:yes stop_codon:yes gene_type:complete